MLQSATTSNLYHFAVFTTLSPSKRLLERMSFHSSQNQSNAEVVGYCCPYCYTAVVTTGSFVQLDANSSRSCHIFVYIRRFGDLFPPEIQQFHVRILRHLAVDLQ